MTMASKMCLNLVRKKVFSSLQGNKSSYLTSTSCRSISSSSSSSRPRPRPMPTLILTPEYDVTVANFRFFSLGGAEEEEEEDGAAVKVMKKKVPHPLRHTNCVGSSHGWLAYYDHREFGFYLANFCSSLSISSPEIIPLPSLPLYFRRGKAVYHDNVRRVVLSSAPNSNSNKCGGCAVVVSHQLNRSLSFCRLGRAESWTRLVDSRLFDYKDFVYSNKNQRLYALSDSTGDIEAWDLDLLANGKPNPQRIELTDIDYVYPHHLTPDEEDKRGSCCNKTEYLVESASGDILLVRRYAHIPPVQKKKKTQACPYKYISGIYAHVRGDYNAPDLLTIRFDVYKLDFKRGKGEYVHNLGDMALFLGFNHSFALSVGDYPELSPNSIYFVDDKTVDFFDRDQHVWGLDMGVYDLERHTVAPICPSKLIINKEILPIWLDPNPNPNSNPNPHGD